MYAYIVVAFRVGGEISQLVIEDDTMGRHNASAEEIVDRAATSQFKQDTSGLSWNGKRKGYSYEVMLT